MLGKLPQTAQRELFRPMLIDIINPDGTADVVAVYDYYPFGMQMSSRSFNSEDYRYGFGGHEKDDELKSNGNHISFGDYGYDPRLGRRWRPDPVDQVSISNYAAFANNPVMFIDPDGKIVMFTGDDQLLPSVTNQLRSTFAGELAITIKEGIINAYHIGMGPISPRAQTFLDAVRDQNVAVGVELTSLNYTPDGFWITGGAFLGSKVIDNTVVAVQYVNPSKAKKHDEFYETPIGTTILHEILEAYIGGVNSPGTTAPTFDTTTPEYDVFLNSHNQAMDIDPRYKTPNIVEQQDDENCPTGIYYIKDLPDGTSTELLINDLSK
jgi:RHS repeat-associated protein